MTAAAGIRAVVFLMALGGAVGGVWLGLADRDVTASYVLLVLSGLWAIVAELVEIKEKL